MQVPLWNFPVTGSAGETLQREGSPGLAPLLLEAIPTPTLGPVPVPVIFLFLPPAEWVLQKCPRKQMNKQLKRGRRESSGNLRII